MRAMAHSPAVPTGNGGYMPHVPTQAEIRGRDWGWFREVAYGALHLLAGHVFAPDEKLATWMLRFLKALLVAQQYIHRSTALDE